MVQLVGYLLCLAGALGGLAVLASSGNGGRGGWRLSLTLVVLLQGGLTLLLIRGSHPPERPEGLPLPTHDDGGYATSAACRSCHPGEYASWHRSFHRSMTEPASEQTIRAPWTGVRLGWHERSYELYKKDTE